MEMVDAVRLDIDLQWFVLIFRGNDVWGHVVRPEIRVRITCRDANDLGAGGQLCFVLAVNDHGTARNVAGVNDFEGDRALLDGNAVDRNFAGNPATARPRITATGKHGY